MFYKNTYSEELKKHDKICRELIKKYSKEIYVLSSEVENYAIDGLGFLPIKGKYRMVCGLELEYNSNFITEDGTFPMPTKNFLAHKCEKYNYYLVGENVPFLPSFYICFSSCYKFVNITQFERINQSKEFQFVETCYDEYGIPFKSSVVKNTLENTVFCKVEDWEEVVMEMLKGRIPKELDLNHKK